VALPEELKMKNLNLSPFALIAAAAAMAPLSAFAIPFLESEPNETKATATLANGMLAGDTLTGQTTGTSVTPGSGATSADYFRVKVAARPLAIYKYQLLASSPSGAAVTVTIRGLSQAAGVIGTADNTFATANGAGTILSPRLSQWYGFGKSEELYYRLTGALTSTAYTATLTETVVSPVVAGSNVVEGNVLIARAAGNTSDTDFWVYDSNFDPIATYGQDDPITPATGMTRSFTPGTYYVAISNFNFANNQANPVDDNFRSSNVLDFPNIAGCSSSTIPHNYGLTFTSSNAPGAPVTVAATKANAFDVVFIQFTVVANTVPTNPVGTLATNPSPVPSGTNFTAALTVAPGTNPASTVIVVNLDASSVGAGTVALLDNGVAPDAILGDNIFSASIAVPLLQPSGPAALPFTVADAQARNSTGTGSITVVGLPPACPTGSEPQSFSGLISTGPVGDAGNGIASLTTTGLYNKATVSGRMRILTTSTVLTEARFRLTGPGGTIVLAQPFATGGVQALNSIWDVASFDIVLPVLQAPGAWTLETYESFNDAGNDASWDNLCVAFSTSPTSPSATSAASGCVRTDIGGTATVTVTVSPGLFPTSTGLGVSLNATALGLGTVAMLDDGNPPDAAIDNIFTAALVVAPGVTVGTKSLAYTISDAELRSGGGNASVVVVAAVTTPTGVTPATAAIPAGSPGAPLASLSGSMVANTPQMWKVKICDPATFSASTVSAANTLDTVLSLFKADGTGIVYNDDTAVAQSTIDSTLVAALPAGDYYLALSVFSNGAISLTDTCVNSPDGGRIWTTSPFTGQRAPNGTGAALPILGWGGSSTGIGSFNIALTGACVPGAIVSDCQSMADVASDGLDTTYTPNGSVGSEDLDAFIAGFIAENAAIADVASDGLDTVRNPNGSVGAEDLDAFIAAFIACS